MEPEYIERKALDKALTAAAAHDKDKNRRTWAKAICILHDLPAADVAPVVHCKDVPIGLRWVIAGTHATMGFCRQRIHMIFVATANETR